MSKSKLKHEANEAAKARSKRINNERIKEGDWYVNLLPRPKGMSGIQEIIWRDKLDTLT